MAKHKNIVMTFVLFFRMSAQKTVLQCIVCNYFGLFCCIKTIEGVTGTEGHVVIVQVSPSLLDQSFHLKTKIKHICSILIESRHFF